MVTKVREDEHLDSVSNPKSRYRLTTLTVDDSVREGIKRFSTCVFPDIPMDSYQRYTVTAADLGRLDRIAYQFYQDSALWWAIALVNNIDNMLEDMEIGDTLYIPPVEEVMKALNV